ncbi:MAG TPA: PEP/pyruvate-binding domain-containing protein [Gaiellaceae bacterium]
MTLASLVEARTLDSAVIGGKAAGLARLAELGLPVPEALVVPTDVHARWRARGEFEESDWRALAEAALALGEPLAVRSSAADEDSGDRSAAGQYESVMDVRGLDGLIAAIEACYRAADSTRARVYRGEREAAMALVVQREVPSDRAGVGFSVDPVTGDDSAVLLEAAFGHGEGVVSGAVTPDRYRVDRSSGAVRARVAEQRLAHDGRGTTVELPPARQAVRVLRDDEARRLADLVLDAEKGFGRPVDVEFCLSGRELWLVQCRPITTLP